MNVQTLPLFVVALTLMAMVPLPAQHANPQTRAQLKERFAQRLPQIKHLKDQGSIGESSTGYLEPVQPEDPLDDQAATLMEQENADRNRLYALIADDPDVKGGRKRVSVEKVAERNARRNFRQAEPGEFLKTRDGHWVQRREVVELKREGKIGETWEGYLEVVTGHTISPSQRALIDLENEIRRDSYQKRAAKSDTPARQEAESAGRHNIDQARPGEYIKPEDGHWEQKP